MAEVDITIAGRHYRVACRDGEEDNLRHAAQLVDGKSREALAGLGALSEGRTLLFASLLLADQLIEKNGVMPPPPPLPPDPQVVRRVDALAERLERLAAHLEKEVASA
ncbi:cell division protein ZapA [Sphingomonas sp. LHG3406-1]|uniref:cell division protein ZapA n=1 Tax=Sphingomonas sp. LHG3406-1 TaxID=2804617 RepID=UPI002617123D|nr:cell division protein ZapA [Sphingomonas sp. LHG3406-1]